MASSHVELYEALRGPVGEKAAAMIAEVVPPAAELATKTDIAELNAHVDAGFAQIKTVRWMLGLFLPVQIGTWASFVVVLLRH